MPTDGPMRLDVAEGLKWLRARLRTRAGRTLVGIDGVDGSGKSTFADDVAQMVAECGSKVIRISLRKYLNPQSVRYAQGRTSPRGFYEDSYDYEKFHDEVLEPLGREGSGRYRTAAYDLAVEAAVRSPWMVAPDDAVVIIDGLFLHRKEFATSHSKKVWDYSVWLEVPFEEAYRRLHDREGFSPDPRDASNARYYEGQLLYLQDCRPDEKADLVIENSHPHSPVDDL
ncbi:MAG: uridine kinase [Actinobacteria bacterium]|nr:uridine kinase [Actinomycetota bacterium]